MKLIICEGTDNTGKSTQVLMLTEELNRKGYTTLNLHFSKMPSFTEEESFLYYRQQALTFNWLDEITKTISKDMFVVICDRFHLGEFVYGPIYRDYKNPYKIFEIEQFLPKDTKLILFGGDLKKVLNREDGFSMSSDWKKRKLEIDRFNIAYLNTNIKDKKIVIIENYNNVNEMFNDISNFVGL